MSEPEGEFRYVVLWGWKNDVREVEVVGDSHYEGQRGLKIRRDGDTVANFDRDAYRSFLRVPNVAGIEPPETRLEERPEEA